MRKTWTSRTSRFLSHRELSKDRMYTTISDYAARASLRVFRERRVHNRAPKHVCGVYVCRLRIYLRWVRWYMEIAPKFPRGEIRLTDNLIVSFPLSVILRAVFVVPFLFRLSRFSSLTLAAPSDPTVRRPNPPPRFASVRALIWSTCMYISRLAVILARLPHSRAESTWNYQDCGPRRRR